MSRRGTTHYHLTHKQGRGGQVVRQPETITGPDAALRLLEEIAARFVQHGCRVVKYHQGVRAYDCKASDTSDQSFEAHACQDSGCGLMPSQSEYGRWTKDDRHKYLAALHERGLMP